MYGAFINGIIYVDRLNPISRKDAIDKAERIIKSGTSMLKCPEGQFNYSFNELVMPLFPGLMKLVRRTKTRVVPVSTFKDDDSKDLHLSFGEPLDLLNYDDKTAIKHLRDTLWSMTWEQMEKYATPVNRADLGEDPKLDYLEKKRHEYLKLKWSKDVWYEEISPYKDKEIINELDVYEQFKSIVINSDNRVHVILLLEYIKKLEEDLKKYDFINYMHENWNKPLPKKKVLKK